MNVNAKSTALNKFRNQNAIGGRPPVSKVLVVYDVQVKPPEVSHIPLIVNYGKPSLASK
jgi:translation initiation factor 4A